VNDFEPDIEPCLAVLRKGGLILYPTDTVWGIGCDATNEEAVARIYRLKQRPDNKSMIVLVAEERDVLQYTAAPDLSVFDHLQATERPTTVIYDGPIGLASNLSGNDATIALRICREPFCRQLIKRLRKPIVSTSANLSGERPASIFPEIAPAIVAGVDYVVNYRQDDLQVARPSRIIRWKNGSIEVIRD
jgi:L-threonylcarbamoyladenylate synthase